MVRPIDEARGWRDEESIDTEIPYRLFLDVLRALTKKYFQKFHNMKLHDERQDVWSPSDIMWNPLMA